MGRDEEGARSPIRADFSVLEIGDEMVPLLELVGRILLEFLYVGIS